MRALRPRLGAADQAVATVGPGAVVRTVQRGAYTLRLTVTPNTAAAPDTFAVVLARNGRPLTGARITLTPNHTEREMPQREYGLRETAPGTYTRAAPALVMVGRWALDFEVTPPGDRPFSALVLDQANG